VLIYGKEIRDRVKNRISEAAQHIPMKMAVLQVGADEAAGSYIRGIKKFADETGVNVEVLNLPGDASEALVLKTIEELNNARDITGIMLQTPFPDHIAVNKVINSISYHKDVEGIHNYNLGKLISKEEGVKPCTPKAVLSLLEHYQVPIEGQRVVIVGRSMTVGSPLATMMTGKNGTVTLCHSRTRDLAEETKRADILVAALGKINFITPDMVNEQCVIIDVGTNFDENGKMYGDVHEEAKAKAKMASAVPGGVGVITVAELFDNLLLLAQQTEK
jgi:methylenetetrahydrofolate dehydrogenase (NADP+)/methenyltetrahydrofolate cyclohydrolase